MLHSLLLTFLKRQELLLDSPHEPIVHIKLYVLPLVILVDGNLLAVQLQLVDLEDAEAVVFHAERRLDDIRDVVFTEREES